MLEEGSAEDVALALGVKSAAEATAEALDAEALDMEADAEDAMLAAISAAFTEGDGVDEEAEELEKSIIDGEEAKGALDEYDELPTTSTLRPVAEGDPEVLDRVTVEDPV